jgi:hypothetical protein
MFSMEAARGTCNLHELDCSPVHFSEGNGRDDMTLPLGPFTKAGSAVTGFFNCYWRHGL